MVYTDQTSSSWLYTVTVKAKSGSVRMLMVDMKRKYFAIDARGQKRFVQKTFGLFSAQPTVPVSANLSISKNENNGTFTIIAKNLKGLGRL